MTHTSLGAPGSPLPSRGGGLLATARRLLTRQPTWRVGLSALMTLGVIASMLAPAAVTTALLPTFAAGNDGVMVLAQATLPRGAAWIPDSTAAGGHLWISDGVLGICRVDPLAGATPPWQRTNCSSPAAAGQIVVEDIPAPAPAGTPAGSTKFVFVADDGSKSNSVVRYAFNPTTATLAAPITMSAVNTQQRGGGGGGTGAGRPVGVALDAHGDLYLAYLKSTEVWRITNASTASSSTSGGAAPANPRLTPATYFADKIGTTSDGRTGVNSLVMFGNDLYLGELSGAGLSRIQDPSGITRPGCSATVQCTASQQGLAGGIPSFFPGGMATDGTYIYIGDAPRAAPNSVIRWDPVGGAVTTVSTNVPPYKASFDGNTYSQYVFPVGIALGPAGPNGPDVYVGDDPTQGLPPPGCATCAPATTQGHVWRVPAGTGTVANPVTVTGLSPTSGKTAGGDVVTITGTGFTPDPAPAPGVAPAPSANKVVFGANAATNVNCTSATTCTATSPAGTGTIDVRVTNGSGLQSPLNSPADQFTYVAAPTTAVSVASVSPSTGIITGGSTVTITGSGFTPDPAPVAGQPLPPSANTVVFGPNAATNVNCASATTCTVTSPAGTGAVDVQVTTAGNTSPVSPGDKFTYQAAAASLYAWGITAPKGGAVWLQGSNPTTGGHWWSSDHAQGFCRQDLDTGPTGNGLHSLNFAACGDDAVGSAGQAVLDPRPIPGATNVNLRYVYVPDNAVKSTAVWRLTFDPAGDNGNGAMVPDPQGGATATAMTPLADVRTLKPNGMALGPDGNLYVTDLTEPNVRQITNPNGDPRTQVISIVAQTGDGRGANGTAGFIGNLLYISENRGTAFFDVTKCPGTAAATPTSNCGTVKVPLNTNAAGVFVAGTAVDAKNKIVYVSDSPGGANATIYRYDASHDVYTPFPSSATAGNTTATCGSAGVASPCATGPAAPILVTGGTYPAAVGATAANPGGVIDCALTCTRPWDSQSHPGGPGSAAGFSFAFGLAVGPNGDLIITEDPTAGNRSGRGSMWLVPFVP